MDIKKYEVLLDAIDKGSFIRACEELGYTQSGLTHMMNSLEKEVGFPLLQRSNKGIQLTPEGREVLADIRELVRLNEQLEQKFSRIRGTETGKVRVGSYPTIACAWLPRIIRRFRELYPGIRVEVQEESSIRRLERNLQEGRLDLGFFSRQPNLALEWIPLQKDPYLAVLPKGHPLAELEAVPAEALMGEEFLMCKSIEGMDPDIVRYFKENGLSIASSYSFNSDTTIVHMVEQDVGVSMLPKLFLDVALNGATGHVVTRPMKPRAYRELGLAARSFRHMSPAMERFVKCARDVLKDTI